MENGIKPHKKTCGLVNMNFLLLNNTDFLKVSGYDEIVTGYSPQHTLNNVKNMFFYMSSLNFPILKYFKECLYKLVYPASVGRI
jgi:hypothetical protein